MPDAERGPGAGAFSLRGRLGRPSVDGYLGAGGVGDKRGAEQLASGPCTGLDSGQNAPGCFGGDGGRCADSFTGV